MNTLDPNWDNINSWVQQSCLHHLFPFLLRSDYVCPFGHSSANKWDIIPIQMLRGELDDAHLDEYLRTITEQKEKTIILWLHEGCLNTESEYALFCSLLDVHKKIQSSLARIQEWNMDMDSETAEAYYQDCLEDSRIDPNRTTSWWTWGDKDELFCFYCWPYQDMDYPRYNHAPVIVISCKSTLSKASVSNLAVKIKKEVSQKTFSINSWKLWRVMQALEQWRITQYCKWTPFYHFERINTEEEFQMYWRMHKRMKV